MTHGQAFSQLARGSVLLIGTCWIAQSAVADWGFGGELAVHGRYVSEGVYEKDVKEIGTAELGLEKETGYGTFFTGVFHLTGLSENYRETEITVGYGNSFGDFSAEAFVFRSITEAFDDPTSYHYEWGLAAAYEGWELLTPGIEFVYEDAGHGEWVSLTVESEFEVAGITFVPSLLLGLDFGYVSDEYDGVNHVEAAVSWDMPLPGDHAMTAYVAYSTALENLEREEEDLNHDYFWVGASFAF